MSLYTYCCICLGFLFSYSVLPAQAQLSGLPDQTIGKWGEFSSLSLNDYVSGVGEWEWSYTFLSSSSPDSIPTWSVNPASFDFSMTITAQVNGGAIPTGSTGDVLGAFIEGEIVGVANGMNVGGTYMFFLTVYHDADTGEVTLAYYSGDQQALYPVVQQFSFVHNSSIGEPLNPELLRAGYIDVQLADNEASFLIVDSTWIGSQGIVMQGKDSLITIQDTFTLSVIDNYTPIWLPIPEQVIPEGEIFITRNLKEFIHLGDEDAVSFSVDSSRQGLETLLIQDSILTVQVPDSSWSGRDTIAVKVMDQTVDQLSSTAYFEYEVIADDQAPILQGIPDQIIGSEGHFSTFDLSQYLSEGDGDSVAFSYRFLPPSLPDSIPNWNLIASQFSLSMTATIAVSALEQENSSPDDQLAAFVNNTLRGLAQPTLVGDQYLYFLVIYGDVSGENISFRLYHADHQRILPVQEGLSFQSGDIIGSPVEPFLLHAGPLQLDLDATLMWFPWRDSLWRGTEQVVFQAQDQGTTQSFVGRDTVAFSVIDGQYPSLDEIPDQIIQEGDSFATIALDNYLLNYAVDSVQWQVSGSNELLMEIDPSDILHVLTPNENWFGEEVVEIAVFDQQDSSIRDWQTVLFRVENVNDTPFFESQAILFAEIDQQYTYVLEAEDIDGDSLHFSALDLPTWLYLANGQSGQGILYGMPSSSDIGVDSIHIQVHDPRGGSADQQFLLQVDSMRTTSLEEWYTDLQVYPIPVTDGQLTVDFGTQGIGQLNIQVIDGMGRMLKQVYVEKVRHRIALDLTGIGSGRYYLLIDQHQAGSLRRMSLPFEVK